MNQEGVNLPSPQDLPKLEKPELIDLIIRQSHQIIRERQVSAQKSAEESRRCKMEMDRLRQSTHQHGQDLTNQNSALLQSLGRMKAETDELMRKLIVLEARNGQDAAPRVQAQPLDPGSTIQVSSQTPALSGENIPLPPTRNSS